MKNKQTPLAIIEGVRTPMAKAFTELSDKSAVELGTHAVNAVINRAMRKSDDFDFRNIDETIIGNVAGPADSANIARVIALSSGIPKDRIAHTVNRNCGLGDGVGPWGLGSHRTRKGENCRRWWNGIDVSDSDAIPTAGGKAMDETRQEQNDRPKTEDVDTIPTTPLQTGHRCATRTNRSDIGIEHG